MYFAADFLGYVGLTALTLLPIINPVGTAVLLLGIGAHLDPVSRGRQTRKACIYASGILIAFLLLGTLIMQVSGISIPGLRIAVAALVCYFVLRAAEELSRKLDSAGIGAIARIMGFLMICIGVQFVINGVGELLHA